MAEVVADLDTEREGVAVAVPTGVCVTRQGDGLDDLLAKTVLVPRLERVPVLLADPVLVGTCGRRKRGGGAGRGQGGSRGERVGR